MGKYKKFKGHTSAFTILPRTAENVSSNVHFNTPSKYWKRTQIIFC